MEYNKNNKYGDVDIIVLNIAYLFIWAAQIAMRKLDRELNFYGEVDVKGKADRLNSAANLFKASVSELYESGKIAKKAEEHLEMAAKKISRAGEGVSKAMNLLDAARSELDIFDEEFGKMAPQDFIQLQRDANEMLAVNILYLYNSYCDINTIKDTISFMENAQGEPVNKYVNQIVQHFLKKSVNIQ